MIRFFVKCAVCDQIFWLATATAPVPEHGRWNRRREPRAPLGAGCPGAHRPGHWLGEDEDGAALTPAEPAPRPSPDTSAAR